MNDSHDKKPVQETRCVFVESTLYLQVHCPYVITSIKHTCVNHRKDEQFQGTNVGVSTQVSGKEPYRQAGMVASGTLGNEMGNILALQ